VVHGEYMATTSPAVAEPKVIGRRRNPVKRESFTLAVYKGDVEELWNFTVRAQMDTSSVFALSAEDTSPGRRLTGLRNFLMRVFVDDDGVGYEDVPVRVVTATDDDEDAKPGALVPVGDDADTIGRTVQYKIGDQVFPSESLARQYADENGSSLRRFVYVMDHPLLTMEQTALEELVEVVVSAAADRPTERSGASSRSPGRRGR
jgi:hypothetical protein